MNTTVDILQKAIQEARDEGLTSRSIAVIVLDLMNGTPCEQIRHQQELSEMVDALNSVMKAYCELVDSGDCGNWNPRNEPVIKKAIAFVKGRLD